MVDKTETFSATVASFVTETEQRMEAVFRDATQSLITDVQLPVAKGGNMRVDTGFLRASGQASLTGMPTGPTRGDPKQKYADEPNVVILVIAKAKMGQTIFFGWTAEYAEIRNHYDGFLDRPVQRWQQYVNASVIKLTNRLNKI